MATKTVAIPEEVHRLVFDVQSDIRKECGINLNISYIVSQVLKNYTKDFAKKLKEGINTGVGNIQMGNLGSIEERKIGDEQHNILK